MSHFVNDAARKLAADIFAVDLTYVDSLSLRQQGIALKTAIHAMSQQDEVPATQKTALTATYTRLCQGLHNGREGSSDTINTLMEMAQTFSQLCFGEDIVPAKIAA